MSFPDILSTIALILGTFFMLVAGLGMLRMPDVFTRMSVTTKAGTVGMIFLLAALVLHFYDIGLTLRALAILLFIMATAPVSAHMIGRAAYSDGVELWEGTQYDELRGHYDNQRHVVTGMKKGRGKKHPEPDHK